MGVLFLGESILGSVVGQLSSCWHSVTTDALSNGKQLVIGISCYWDFWRKSVVGCNLALNPKPSPEGLKSSVEGGVHITVGVALPRWLCRGGEWMEHTLIAPHTKFQMQRTCIC